jgi:hypothetical protein
MTERTLFFVVSRLHGRPIPALYWDELPRAGVRNLDYVVRLDQLPPDSLLRLDVPLARRLALYTVLHEAHRLPPRWKPPAKKAATS